MIEAALPYNLGDPLESFYIISTNKLYKGFWGKNNGYNGIIIIGVYKDKYYFVNKEYQCDVMDFRYLGNIAKEMMIEIPHENNAIHMWWCHRLICFKELLSSMLPCYYGDK